MKRILLILFISAGAVSGSWAQTGQLFGVTNGTASTGFYGTIFRVNPNTGSVTTVFSFDQDKGWALNSGVIQGSDGYLYGAARYGGTFDKGTIFRIKPDGTEFTKLHDFSGADGEDPMGGLVEGPNNFLYGSTSLGGAYAAGTFYRISMDGSIFQTLFEFDYSGNGANPNGRPLAIGGKYYLCTQSGGAMGRGTLLMVDPNTTFTKLLDFDGATTGGNPVAGLILGSDSLIYGTTSAGGSNEMGVLFSITRDGSTFQKLFDFSLENGSSPLGTLVETTSGELVGTTFGGGGAVVPGSGIFYNGTAFKISKDGSNYTKLRNFGEPGDGSFPDGGLVQVDTLLYGITLFGGANESGTVFRINSDGSFYEKTFDFAAGEGSPRYVLTKLQDITSPAPTIGFETTGTVQDEGSGSYTIRLPIIGSLTQDSFIDIAVIEGRGIDQPRPHRDYKTFPVVRGDSLSFVIPAGSTEVSFEFIPLKDRRREADETVTFIIKRVGPYLVGAQGRFDFTILDVRRHEPPFRVYPNPTRGEIHISYGGESEDEDENDQNDEQVIASLRSQHGHLVFRATGDLSEVTEQLAQVLKGSQPGVYILRLQREDEVQNLRIVIQR